MEFIVTDRESIESSIVVRSAYAVISIHDPDKRRPRIPKQSGLREVLYLAFHDAEPSEKLALPEDIVLMTEDQAREVWSFVKKWQNEIGTVVVHCEQGVSRSPAVAAALCRGFGGDERPFWRAYQPNQYVYELVLRAAEGSAQP
jgi:predicted protein tyrosine phosphatase